MQVSRIGLKKNGACLAGILLFWLLPASVWAQSDTLDRVREGAKQIHSLEAGFIQKKQMKILLKPLVSKGYFYFKAPGSIRWEYRTPINSVITMHKGDIKRFFRMNGKMVSDSGASLQVMQVVLQYITLWLGGQFDDNSDFKVSATKTHIELTPRKSMPGMIARIELRLSDQPGIIDEIVIVEDKENNTKIEFIGLKVNQPISDSVFQEIP